MKQKHRDKPRQHTDTAVERIVTLFDEAEASFSKDRALSDRYVQLALKISTSYKVRLPIELKKRFCKHCHAYLKPPVNCTIRLNKGKLVYRCQGCDGCMRFPYKKGKPSQAEQESRIGKHAGTGSDKRNISR
jgi:ribonuclease P protein subunit RPR2